MLFRPSAAATVVVLIAVLGTTSAFRKLCITGDNFITGLWMANNSYIDKMRHASEVRKFDCVTMPPNPTVIAVEAYNAKSWAGILSYETGNGAPYRDWKCAAAADVTDESWMTTTFDDSSWAAAKHFGLVWHRNRELAFVHEAKKHHAYSWIWTSQVHDKYKHVYCRLTLCQDNCKSCTQGGPGTCDPDMCLIGEGYDEVKEVPRCNNKCCLALHLYGSNTPDSVRHNASFTLTDGMSKKSTSQHLHWPGQLWKQKAPGHYVGVLDFGNCTLYNLDYRNLDNEAEIVPEINTWNTEQAYTKDLSVDFIFGSGSKSYDPFLTIQLLNGTVNGLLRPLFNDRVSRFSGCLTGVNNGDVTISEVSAKRWPQL